MSRKGRVNNSYVLKFTCSMVSIIFVLVGGEITLRFTSYKNFLLSPYPFLGYVIADESSGFDISKNFAPKTSDFIDTQLTFWSNEFGCWDKPYKDEQNYILLVGDSFTWAFVQYEHKYGTFVEQYLDYRVLQCGVSGYGPKQELVKIQKIIERVNTSPKLILVGYYLGNDFQDDYLFPRYTVIDGYPVDKVRLVDKVTWEKEIVPGDLLRDRMRNFKKYGQTEQPNGFPGHIRLWLKKHSIIYNLCRKSPILVKLAGKTGVIQKAYTPIFYQIEQYPYLKTAWEDHLNTLKAIKRVADKYGAKLLIVLVPPPEQIYDFLRTSDKKKYDLGKLNTMLKTFFHEESIDYVDLTSVFRKYANQTPRQFLDPKKDLYWPYTLHWNGKGNLLAGLLITEHIIDKNMLEIPEELKKRTKVKEELKKLARRTDF